MHHTLPQKGCLGYILICMHRIFLKIHLSACLVNMQLKSVDLGVLQQCLLFACNVLFKNFSKPFKINMVNVSLTQIWFATIGFTWLVWLLTKNASKLECYKLKKKTIKVLFGKSGAYKFKYTAKPLLSRNTVHFTMSNKIFFTTLFG